MTDTTSPTPEILPGPPATEMEYDERLKIFTAGFDQLCKSTGINAASIVLVPIKGQPGRVSIEARGHVPTIQFIGRMIDKNTAAAHYRLEREERKRAEFAKRNPQAAPAEGS